MAKNNKILWVDDEIDLLKAHVIFLEQKGYEVSTATNGIDAIEMVKNNKYNLIFLDENMPGYSGLETLAEIKNIMPGIPVIMITKSEEENIMDEAIGSKINDYLIKPVNPNQILLSIKKNIHNKQLVTQKTTMSYQAEFRNLSLKINESNSYEDWFDIYKKLVFWEMELANSDDNTMDEVLKMQINDANNSFTKYIKNNYKSWFENNSEEKPLTSVGIFSKKVFPHLKDNNENVYFLLIDNLRYDQWRVLRPLFTEFFNVDSEELYFSILPTATQYSRNSIFSGLMPSEINKLYPQLWKNDDEVGGKNLYEEEMLLSLMQRYNIANGLSFEKVTDINYCKKIIDNLNKNLKKQLNVVIINFIDNLSHAKTDQKMIKDLAHTEKAYRSLTKSWMLHSPLYQLVKEIAKKKVKLIISTDHGSIRVNNPIKVVGDKNTTTNLRYKQGRNLNYNPKEIYEITNPQEVFLPKTNISSTYIFSSNNDFFAYPNNYNHYVNYYKDTFQHGGISMQEMIIPIITLNPK